MMNRQMTCLKFWWQVLGPLAETEEHEKQPCISAFDTLQDQVEG